MWRSKYMCSTMSACGFINVSVANAERSTGDGYLSRDRVMCSLFHQALASQDARSTVGCIGGSIAKAVVMSGSNSVSL
jgi:hypothetical protein